MGTNARSGRAALFLWENIMKKTLLALMAGAAVALAAQPASAITWTDWTAASAGQVTGTAGSVGVTYTGSYSGVQLSPATDFYNGSGFPVALKPSNTDIIQLTEAGTKSITFSTAVTDVYLAIVSWNGNDVTFSSPFTIEAMGCGFWGCGTVTQYNGGLSFSSTPYPNEPHGVLKFAGPITSLVFTDSFENWHGITVGFEGVSGAVPEPASWAMMIGGFALAGAAMRRRKAAVRFA